VAIGEWQVNDSRVVYDEVAVIRSRQQEQQV
jgi:hypothetical protein